MFQTTKYTFLKQQRMYCIKLQQFNHFWRILFTVKDARLSVLKYDIISSIKWSQYSILCASRKCARKGLF